MQARLYYFMDKSVKKKEEPQHNFREVFTPTFEFEVRRLPQHLKFVNFCIYRVNGAVFTSISETLQFGVKM